MRAGLFRSEQSFRADQVDRYQSAHALFDHGHSKKAVHSAHRHSIVSYDKIAGVGLLGHLIQKLAEALDIGIVERRIDFVEDADRCRVGQKQRENERNGGQRLLASRKKSEGGKALSRRLSHDLNASFERVVAFDPFEMAWPPSNRVVNSRRK